MSNKNKYSYVGITLVILVFGIIFIPKIVDRISNKDVSREESRSTTLKPNEERDASSDLAYLVINGERKRVPEFKFINQYRDTITNEDYLGKVYVVEFFFTTCPTICPRMNQNLVQIQNTFQSREDFGIASFTITPHIDTPEVLKDYAQRFGITHPNWHLMTGDQETIYKLANEGFNLYTAEDKSVEGGFEHSGNFALIDKEGYIRSRYDKSGNPLIFYNGIVSEAEGVDDDGISQEITILKEDITKLLQEK
ncbi:MAG: SCO family protein [Bacteroidia bacterium]|nr:SCO family protein [Bacteroidia bacterium]